jgi:hypothetical protein
LALADPNSAESPGLQQPADMRLADGEDLGHGADGQALAGGRGRHV